MRATLSFLSLAMACEALAVGCEEPQAATPAAAAPTATVTPAPAAAPPSSSPPPGPASPSTGASAGTCPSPVPRYAAVADVALPARWVRATAPAPDSETLRCANLSRREWIVGPDGTPAPAPVRTGDKLPFRPDPKSDMRGAAHVKTVDDGLLVGFDAGEWGGALYATAADGSHARELAKENVVGFAELGGDVVVLTGLAHMGVSQGKVLHLWHGPEGWRVNASLDLGAAVQTFAPESRDTLLALTTSGLYRVTACGDVSLVAPARYDVLYPSSMTIDARGVITIGMRHFVTRWLPNGDGTFREEWLTRDDCTLMQLRKFECICHREDGRTGEFIRPRVLRADRESAGEGLAEARAR